MNTSQTQRSEKSDCCGFEAFEHTLDTGEMAQIQSIVSRQSSDSVLRMFTQSTAHMLPQKTMAAQYKNIHASSPFRLRSYTYRHHSVHPWDYLPGSRLSRRNFGALREALLPYDTMEDTSIDGDVADGYVIVQTLLCTQGVLDSFCLRGGLMQITYFAETDTLRITFARKESVETREINENIRIELDQDGHLVRMTIAHARQQMDIEQISYESIAQTMHSVHTIVINPRGSHAHTPSESRSL